MNKRSRFTIASIAFLIIAFIIQLAAMLDITSLIYQTPKLAFSGDSAFAYLQKEDPSFGGYFRFIGMCFKTDGFTAVTVTLALFAPLLWAFAFGSGFTGRLISGIFLAMLTLCFYIKAIIALENFISRLQADYGSDVTNMLQFWIILARAVVYGGSVVTIMMLASIFTGVRVTSLISAIGVLVFTLVLFSIAVMLLVPGSRLNGALIIAFGQSQTEFIKSKYMEPTMVIACFDSLLILLGKLFGCLGAVRKN